MGRGRDGRGAAKGMGDMRTGWTARTWARLEAWRRRAADERGVALVEAAIVFPLIIALTFGCIEFGFAFNEQGTLRAATRTAARTASASPKAPVALFESSTAEAATQAVKNLVTGIPQELWIYDADPTDSGTYAKPGGCGGGRCAKYVWDPATEAFVEPGAPGGSWDETEREACPGDSDRVGVFISVQHRYLSGVPVGGSSGVLLTSNTIMALEPFPGPGCGGP
ncbi:MAG: TadE/TadG family type IV pilus assembly protein [Actinomycetota bacterium]